MSRIDKIVIDELDGRLSFFFQHHARYDRVRSFWFSEGLYFLQNVRQLRDRR